MNDASLICKFGFFKNRIYVVVESLLGRSYSVAFLDSLSNRLDTSTNYVFNADCFVGITSLETDNSLLIVYYDRGEWESTGYPDENRLVVEKLSVDADLGVQSAARRAISPWEPLHSTTACNFYRAGDLCYVMWGAISEDMFVRAVFVASQVTPSADPLPCMQTAIALGDVEVDCYGCETYCDMGDGQIRPSIVGSNNSRIIIQVLCKDLGVGLVHVETASPFLHKYESGTEVESSIVDTQSFGGHMYFLIKCELEYKPDALHLKTRIVHYLVSTSHSSEVLDSRVQDDDEKAHYRFTTYQCAMHLRAGDAGAGCVACIAKTPPDVVGIFYSK
jgi:hypothetical protein